MRRAAWALAALLLAGPGGAAAAPPRLGPAPNFALTTQLDDRVWLAHLRGRAVVLGFGCTACGACPALVPALRAIAQAPDPAARGRLFFALVTLDPARDTPAVLRRFARGEGLDPATWLLLTGSPAEVEVVARWYGLAARPDASPVGFACGVALVDAGGVLRGRYGAGDLAPLRADLTALLAEPRPAPR